MFMMPKIYKTLEFDKILELLQNYFVLDKNKDEVFSFPLMNEVETIDYALNETLEATKILQRLGRNPLYFSSDISYLLSKTKKDGVLSVSELLEISKFMDSIRDTYLFLENLKNYNIEHFYFEKSIEKLEYLKDLNLEIKSIITPYGEIKDDASPTLKQIRKTIKNLEITIQKKLQEFIQNNASKLTQKTISIRNDRYVIAVKNDFKNTIKGLIHDQSASGETVFIEPQIIIELNNTLNNNKVAEEQEINRILRGISNKIKIYFDSLSQSYQILLHFDFVFSKAKFALQFECNKPIVNKDGIIDLVNCFHPLLNVETVVKNNITLGKDYQCMIITGPNTGGKTVLLKTVGLLSLMTKFGLLIPCAENSHMNIFDQVFADIGDEQSIDQNLSTFSSHMTNIIDIINNVTENSLVLLDELGSGTDPAEGSSLAVAIIDYLLTKKCLIITTSHYSELKVFGFNSDKIINASVEFDVSTLKPTYKLLMGVPGQSHAFQISKRLGLKEEIIKRAENYSFERSDKLDKVLEKLISQTHELDQKISQVNQKYQEYLALQAKLDQEIKQTILERDQILQDANKKAEELIKEKLVKAQELITYLQSLQQKSIKPHELIEAKYQLKQIKEENLLTKTTAQDEDFFENEQVFIPKYQTYGIILKENKNNTFDVQIGNATVKLNKQDLQKTSKEVKNKPTSSAITKISSNITRNVGLKLDLRGKRYEEAKILLEKYLDDCLVSGLNEVIIIHGYGTGTIRNLVQDFLRNNPHVESFRYGDGSEGGFGATVVKIKK